MDTNFSKIKTDSLFLIEGVTYRKISDTVFEDITLHIETYWSPQLDAKIEPFGEETKPAAQLPEKFITDPQTRLVKLNPNYLDPIKLANGFERLFNTGFFGEKIQDIEGIVDKAIEYAKSNVKKL